VLVADGFTAVSTAHHGGRRFRSPDVEVDVGALLDGVGRANASAIGNGV
jgi:hypothetical protein